MESVRTAIFLAAALLAAVPASAEERLAARVNGVGIPQAAFDRSWKVFLERSGIPGSHADKAGQLDEFRQKVVDELIDAELLYQDAKAKSLLAGGEQVDAALAGAKEQFPTPEAFAAALAQSGLSEVELRAIFARNLSIRGLVEQDIAKGVSVSDADVHDFYVGNLETFQVPERVRARHILVEVAAEADAATRDAARAKADGLLARLRAGEDFAELAKTGSDCPTAPDGGDLGYFARGQMVGPFEAAAFALEPGKTSDVVETPFGYHIIRVEERKAAGPAPEAEIAPQIREFLAVRKTEEAVAARVKALREKATIEVLLKL